MDVSFLGQETWRQEPYFQTLSISSTSGAYLGFPGDPLTFGATIGCQE